MNAASHSSFSRRGFLKLGTGAVAAASLSGEASAAVQAARSAKIPIGLQLYSVRHQCEKDLPGVLKAVGKFGYKGVEFAGYYGRTASELRKLLDENGLVCCGTHTGLDTVTGDNLKATIEFNKTIGNKYLIVPYMEAEGRDGWLEKAKLFNELADQVKPEGMLIGYHAHSGDFKPIDGNTAWDIFFGHTKREVVMQLDTANCIDGGGDPVAVLGKFQGRATTIHLKEVGGPADAVIGGGEVKWRQIFRLCEAGGTEWYIVEHERGGSDPVGDVGRCLEALRQMGKA